MNWKAKDIDTYSQQKEYIDTLIVPLLKIETTIETMKISASSSEFLMHLTSFIETQFKGRVMLMPPFSYTASFETDTMGEMLANDLREMPFKHIFYITTDAKWTNSVLKGQVIWLPSIPLESMDNHLRQTIIEDQLRQVIPLLTEKWSAQ